MIYSEYINKASRTTAPTETINLEKDTLITYLKLTAKVIENLDLLKKKIYYNKPIDTEAFKENLIDVAGLAADMLSVDLDDDREEKGCYIDADILHGSIGIATESGELIEAIVKVLESGEELDTVNLKEELGDVSWYYALLVNTLADSDSDKGGELWENILKTNIDKLAARYPEKFTQEKAISRDLDTERKILED
jgi:NTP pyrophosphatase (non-canonical NTP hydrolase)